MSLISSPSEQIPNYRQRAARNVFRDAILGALAAGDDDALMLGVGSVLLALLRNASVDERLLQEAALCTRQHRRRLTLLSALIGSSGNGNNGINNGSNGNSNTGNGNGNGNGNSDAGTLSSAVGGASANGSASDAASPSSPSPSASPATESTSSTSSSSSSSSLLSFTPSSSSSVSLSATSSLFDGSSDSAATTDALLTSLLGALNRRPLPRLVTVQLILALIAQLTGSKPSSSASSSSSASTSASASSSSASSSSSSASAALLPSHLAQLRAAHAAARRDLYSRMRDHASSAALGDSLLDTLEDECRALLPSLTGSGGGTGMMRPSLAQVLSAPVALLPITASAISGIEFEYRLPAGEAEKTRRAVQVSIQNLALHYTFMT
jgi:hypothetical protein